MPKKENKMRLVLVLIFVVGVVAILAGIIFFSRARLCDSKQCFDEAILNCTRAFYISDAEDSTWRYEIYGRFGDSCRINARLLQLKKGSAELEKSAGLDMTCDIPVGIIVSPAENLAFCHGELKEHLQIYIIQNLHRYILEKLGKSENFTSGI